MRRLKVTLPAGVTVAALRGLAGCGGSSNGTTDAGAAIPGSTATSATGTT